MDYVAGDCTRVVLQPPVSGTDYVNASWVPGYSGDRAFIVSQHPNNFSLEQFWHMVWQTDTRTIICLSAFQQPVSDARYQMLSSFSNLELHFNVRCGRSCLYDSHHCTVLSAAQCHCCMQLLQGAVLKSHKPYIYFMIVEQPSRSAFTLTVDQSVYDRHLVLLTDTSSQIPFCSFHLSNSRSEPLSSYTSNFS